LCPTCDAKAVVASSTFAPLNDRPLYIRNGECRLQQYLRSLPPFADVVVMQPDLAVVSGNAETATTDQWNLVQEFRAIIPDGDVKLRFHKLTLKHRPDAPGLTLFAVRVTRKIGPFTLQREYAIREDYVGEGTADIRSLAFSETSAKEICMT
jgi:hypothetical protein